MMERLMFLLGLRVIFALFCAVINGIDLSFNVYAVPLKDTFDFTQTQVEALASMICVGFGLAFKEILLSSKFGNDELQHSSLPGSLYLSHTDYLALRLYTTSSCTPSQCGSMSYRYACVTLSNAVTLTLVRNVVVGILPKRFVGTIIGLTGSAVCLGKIAYSGLLELICHNDLAKFFFTMSIVSSVFLSLFYPLLYPAARELESYRYRQSHEESHTEKESLNNYQRDGESLDHQDTELQGIYRRNEESHDHQSAESLENYQRDGESQDHHDTESQKNYQRDWESQDHQDTESQRNYKQDKESQEKSYLKEYKKENTPLEDMIKCRYFHMTFWTSTVFASAAYTVLNNITSITSSIGMKESFNIITTMSVSIMIIRVVYGMLFDKVASQTFAFWLLFSMYFSFALGLILGLCCLNSTTVYIIGVLCGIAVGRACELPVSMLVFQYGRSNLNLIFVAFYFTLAAGQLIMQMMTGYLYDRNVITGTSCQGTHCFCWSFVFLLCLTVLIIIFQFINYLITFHKCIKS